MNHPSSRREFLLWSLAAAAGWTALPVSSARGAEPVRRAGAPRFKLSLVAYSFRKAFQNHGVAKPLTLFEFIDYCADHGFDAAEVTGYYFPAPLTPESLIAVKRHAFLRGVALSGTAMRSSFASPDPTKTAEQIASVKTWIDRAALLGAPYLRVLAGPGKQVQQPAVERACIAGLEECAEYAGAKGVFLGLENDSGVGADSLLAILRGVQSPWLGINLDLANFQSDDIYREVARCAPYAINVHFRKNLSPLGGGTVPVDEARMLGVLRAANYQGYLALKCEGAEDPYTVIPGWKHELEAALGSA